MLRPFWCNDSTVTLPTLDDRPFMHGDILPVPDTLKGPYLKNQAKLGNSDQLMLQDLSGAPVRADSGEEPSWPARTSSALLARVILGLGLGFDATRFRFFEFARPPVETLG
jgi:hypothetical protein